jgi:hypothetical protein
MSQQIPWCLFSTLFLSLAASVSAAVYARHSSCAHHAYARREAATLSLCHSLVSIVIMMMMAMIIMMMMMMSPGHDDDVNASALMWSPPPPPAEQAGTLQQQQQRQQQQEQHTQKPPQRSSPSCLQMMQQTMQTQTTVSPAAAGGGCGVGGSVLSLSRNSSAAISGIGSGSLLRSLSSFLSSPSSSRAVAGVVVAARFQA